MYTEIDIHEKEIANWCEKSGLDLNAKQIKSIANPALWKKQKALMETAGRLMKTIGTGEYNDFNLFRDRVDEALKQESIKLSAAEKNTILNAVSWYDETAEKVVKSVTKFAPAELKELLEHLNCAERELPDYGYYPTGKKTEYLQYETESDLRDTENVPLKENIYNYFLQEVKPHVAEAWINLDATQMGYEISFNKHFFRPKPLRSVEEISEDILALEEEGDGLIREILNLA